MPNYGYMWKALLFVALKYSFLAPAKCVYENEIQAFFTELRLRMCHPIPNLGLPQLDPFEIGPASIYTDNKYLIDFSGSIDEFKVHGLSDFDVPVDSFAIRTNPLQRSSINITLPYTYFQSLYTAKGSLAYILNLAGDGNAETLVKDFSVLITFRLKAGLYLGISQLTIDFHLGDLKINFDNLLEEERINDFVHALVNEMGVELLDDIWDYEQGTVVEIVEETINSYIGKYSLADIIKLITGGGSEGESPPIFEGVEPDCKD